MRYSLISYPDVLPRGSNVHPRAQGLLGEKRGKRAGEAARREDLPVCGILSFHILMYSVADRMFISGLKAPRKKT